MRYPEVVISEDALRDACSRSYDADGGEAMIFFRMNNEQRVEGITRDITSEGFSILLLHPKDGHAQRVEFRYKDVGRWAVLNKLELAREYQRLADGIEYIGGNLD